MGRIAATLVVLAGVALMVWVGTRGDDPAEGLGTPAPAAGAAGTVGPAPAGAGDDTASGRTAATPERGLDAPDNYGPRPDLVGLDGWLNTDATSLSDFDGKVLIVEMWTFGCRNCKARLPYDQSYHEQFAGRNFEIIGVHAPEFGYEADVSNIEAALVDLGVTWPVALDTDKRNFRAWQSGTTSYWPRTYVVDQNGDIRYDHIGEGDYEELRAVLQYLLDHPPSAATP